MFCFLHVFFCKSQKWGDFLLCISSSMFSTDRGRGEAARLAGDKRCPEDLLGKRLAWFVGSWNFAKRKQKGISLEATKKKNNILTPKAPTPNIRNQATKKHVKLQCWWHLFDLFSNSLNLWKLSHHGRGLPTQSTRDARRWRCANPRGFGWFFFFGRSKGNLKHTPLED